MNGGYVWGDDGKFGTSTEIGTGEKNTETIASKSTSVKNNAAQACLDYSVNGYDDWFLPSKDELNLMYTNLHLKKLGGFANGFYWSSSEYIKDPNSIWAQSYNNGSQYFNGRSTSRRVRPIRAF